jgi:putative phosphonate transport system ATP-binding protein
MCTALPSPPLMQVRGISKSFGQRVALQDVSFDLWPGEVLAVVGESGSGKSTLLNAIAARNLPDAGNVQFLTRQDGHGRISGCQRG